VAIREVLTVGRHKYHELLGADVQAGVQVRLVDNHPLIGRSFPTAVSWLELSSSAQAT
jgi:hypothetical protein